MYKLHGQNGKWALDYIRNQLSPFFGMLMQWLTGKVREEGTVNVEKPAIINDV